MLLLGMAGPAEIVEFVVLLAGIAVLFALSFVLLVGVASRMELVVVPAMVFSGFLAMLAFASVTWGTVNSPDSDVHAWVHTWRGFSVWSALLFFGSVLSWAYIRLVPADTTSRFQKPSERRFQPGCRLSREDVLVMLVAIFMALGIAFSTVALSAYIVFVVAHFFLFRNVFRISRPSEVIWAGAFSVLVYCSVLGNWFAWLTVLLLMLPITVTVIGWELRKPSYHGLGWQRFNPDLENWWNATRVAAGQPATGDESV